MKVQKLLHRYWSKRLKALKEIFNIQISAIRKAVKVALKAMEKRLKQMNEIRGQLKVQKDEFYTRTEGTILEKSLEDYKERMRLELQPLKDQKLLLDNKADQKAVNRAFGLAIGGLLLGIISLIVSIILFILK